MAKITALTQDLYRYMIRNRSAEESVLAELRHETERAVADWSGMMISEEQGVLLRILIGALAPKLAVEVGTFTGYSAICMASALPTGGKLLVLRRERRMDGDRDAVIGSDAVSLTESNFESGRRWRLWRHFRKTRASTSLSWMRTKRTTSHTLKRSYRDCARTA